MSEVKNDKLRLGMQVQNIVVLRKFTVTHIYKNCNSDSKKYLMRTTFAVLKIVIGLTVWYNGQIEKLYNFLFFDQLLDRIFHN